MVTHIARVWINRVRLPILLVVSSTGKINIISLSAFAPENLVSRDGFSSSPVPRQSAHPHTTQAESSAYLLRDSSRVPRRRPFIDLKIVIRHRVSSEFIGSRNQLRIDAVHCRESAGTGSVNLKGSSERVLPCLAGHHGPINMRLSFSPPLLV